MPTFTPRTTKEGISSPSSPYNDIHYVGGLTTNHNSNKYNYNNVIMKLLINIKLLYKENDYAWKNWFYIMHQCFNDI